MDLAQDKKIFKERLDKSLRRKQELLSERTLLLQTYNKLERELDNYSAMFLAYEEVEEKTNSKHNPIIIGNAHTRMSILDIGRIDINNTMIINGYIFPNGYKAKRKYLRHNNCVKNTSDGKIFYFCNVNDVWSIECTCGKEYKDFEQFKNDFNGFCIESVEDFFGLTHVSVISMIEEMSDANKIKGYTKHNDDQ